MPFPTYSSAVTQTIYTVNHFDGAGSVYVFTASGPSTGPSLATSASLRTGAVGQSYTPTSQDEKWIMDYMALNYGLSSV